jgi:anthranilate phosphoribosyltransferase
MLNGYIKKLSSGENLNAEESSRAAALMADESVDNALKQSFLLKLAEKGETAEEVTAFASVFRGLARDPGLSKYADRAIDVCGTGGDKSGSFNISTVVSFILASAGVPVFKHGNRSITSSCGSADFLEAVGIKLDANKVLLQKSIEELNYVFLFAPAFHPAFKAVLPVRKALAEKGNRTIFNVLGPLINPGRPSRQLMGVFSDKWVTPLAESLHNLGLSRGMVVNCSANGGGSMDELSCAGINHISGFGSLRGEVGKWRAEDFGLATCNIADLKGGNVQDNLKILDSLLAGRGTKGLEDTVVFNAGVALWIAEKADDVRSGILLARGHLLGGSVKTWLNKIKEVYK